MDYNNKDSKSSFSRTVLIIVQVFLMLMSFIVLIYEVINVVNFSKLGASSGYWMASCISIVIQIMTMCWLIYSIVVISGDYENFSNLLFIEIICGALVAFVAAIAISTPTYLTNYQDNYAKDLRANYNLSDDKHFEFWQKYSKSKGCCGVEFGLFDNFDVILPELSRILIKNPDGGISIDPTRANGDKLKSVLNIEYCKETKLEMVKAIQDLVASGFDPQQIMAHLKELDLEKIINKFGPAFLTIVEVFRVPLKKSCGQQMARDQVLARQTFLCSASFWLASHIGVAFAFLYARSRSTVNQSTRFVAPPNNFIPMTSSKAIFNPNIRQNSVGRRA